MIEQSIDDARREADAAEFGPYQELMATYAALGMLLDSGRADASYVEDCGDLVRRLVKLGEWVGRDSDQRWAVWMAANTVFGGGG